MNNTVIKLDEAIPVIREVLSSGGSIRIYPGGISMKPHIVEGRDSVLLASKSEVALSRHDIAFYQRENGQYVLHRVVKVNHDGSYDMCGDSQLGIERAVAGSQIIGYVKAVYRGDRELDPKSFSQRLYRTFWCNMTIRRIINFFARAMRRIKRIFLKIFVK